MDELQFYVYLIQPYHNNGYVIMKGCSPKCNYICGDTTLSLKNGNIMLLQEIREETTRIVFNYRD